MKKIFVYGTLKKHHHNFRLIKNGVFCGDGILSSSNNLRMISLGTFPALVPSEKEDSQNIVGEIWKVDEEIFKSVDYLEGYPNFYNRKKFKINRKDNIDDDVHECWVYFLPDKLGSEYISSVAGGTWI